MKEPGTCMNVPNHTIDLNVLYESRREKTQHFKYGTDQFTVTA